MARRPAAPADGDRRFSDTRADAAQAFFENRLTLTKGRWSGVRFILPDWQRDGIIRPLFGWERFDGQLGRWVRQYRKAWIEVPKKNGKSPLGAGIALQGLVADREGSPEVYSVAASKRQAGIVFSTAASMVRLEPALAARCEVYASKLAHHGVIHTPRTDGYYRVIPGDAALDDGITPSRVVVDEVHRIRNRGILDLLDESFAAREEPLIVYLTTAGEADETSIAWELHQHAAAVRDGLVRDPFLFVYIAGASVEETDGDGWRDEELWRRVNPAIDSFNPGMLTDLRTSAAAAEISPAKVVAFKRLRLNVWLPPSVASRDQLVDVAAWDATAGMVDVAGHKNAELFAGLDMASTEDVAALVGVFPNVGGCANRFCDAGGDAGPCYDVIARFFVPESVLSGSSTTWTRALISSLQAWIADGFVDVVEGDVIDDRSVVSAVDDWRRRFDLVELAKDPYQSKQLGLDLEDAGLVVWDHGQSMERMSEPTKRFVHLIRDRRLHAGGNPVLRWMISNVVARTDSNGNMKPDRRKSSGKIDGVVALIMAIAAAERADTEPELFGFTVR